MRPPATFAFATSSIIAPTSFANNHCPRQTSCLPLRNSTLERLFDLRLLEHRKLHSFDCRSSGDTQQGIMKHHPSRVSQATKGSSFSGSAFYSVHTRIARKQIKQDVAEQGHCPIGHCCPVGIRFASRSGHTAHPVD
jgi:hypothetical protein